MTTVVGFHMLLSKVFGIRYPSQFLHLYPDLPFFISFKLSAPLFSSPPFIIPALEFSCLIPCTAPYLFPDLRGYSDLNTHIRRIECIIYK